MDCHGLRQCGCSIALVLAARLPQLPNLHIQLVHALHFREIFGDLLGRCCVPPVELLVRRLVPFNLRGVMRRGMRECCLGVLLTLAVGILDLLDGFGAVPLEMLACREALVGLRSRCRTLKLELLLLLNRLCMVCQCLRQGGLAIVVRLPQCILLRRALLQVLAALLPQLCQGLIQPGCLPNLCMMSHLQLLVGTLSLCCTRAMVCDFLQNAFCICLALSVCFLQLIEAGHCLRYLLVARLQQRR
mmetsp:Transcript_62057/g.176275  ORF Transcript_62057/g.176275 Transcript_62057/m.176275 type:complete len:245 (-) Transcript_62057:1196-1930(-)